MTADPPTPAYPEHRYALIVGVNGAASAAVNLAPLKYAESDALALGATLSAPACAFELSEPPLIGAAASSHAIKHAIMRLTHARGEADTLLLYFCGHAEQLRTDDGGEEVFLIAHDFAPHEAKRDPTMHLSMRWLFEHVYRAPDAGNVMIILDCCSAGNFRAAESDPLQIDLRRLIEYYRDERSHRNQPRDDRARVVLAATGYNQAAFERDGHGLMTGLILKALNGEVAAARDADGNVTIQRLHEYLQRNIADQHPDLIGNLSRPLIFARHHGAVPAAPLPRLQRLRMLQHDQGHFLRDRLSSFVGREYELGMIRQKIDDLRATGGFVLVTGQPGQGKSSMLVRLIHEYGPEQVAYHFIPINPGPDHQVGLLRNLISRLVLIHQLDELDVASDIRAALRDYMPHVLTALAARGRTAVIFIDGLDQLEEEINGERDLSFLPSQPYPGIVFVLSSRPNDTLQGLQHLQPVAQYQLPELSRADFERMLARDRVRLTAPQLERFYQAMRGNALYLDLVARELRSGGAQPIEQLLKQISDDPDHLFSITMRRLKRRRQEWRETIKPLLGALMTAAEPLNIQALRQLVANSDDEMIRDGIDRLGGLVISDGAGRYALYHSKLHEFLRQDDRHPEKSYIFAADEEEQWHERFADWCERAAGGLPAIWQDRVEDRAEQERRRYARRHYIGHLFHSKHWERLWKVLDAGEHGRGKLRRDPSGHSYVQDLELGRQAIVQSEWALATAAEPLARLWRYSLLRARLLHPADGCPESVFEALVLCGRKQEAVGLAELIGPPEQKSAVLRLVGMRLAGMPEQRADGLLILQRAAEVALHIAQPMRRNDGLAAIALGFAQLNAGEFAWRCIEGMHDGPRRCEALKLAAMSLAQAGDHERALAFTHHISDIAMRAQALATTAELWQADSPLRLAAELEQAAGECAAEPSAAVRIDALQALAWVRLMRGEQASALEVIEMAAAAAQAIDDPLPRTGIWLRLARLLRHAGARDRAQYALEQAIGAANTIAEPTWRAERLCAIAVQAGDLAGVQPLFMRALHGLLALPDPWLQSQSLQKFAEVVFASAYWQCVEPLIQTYLSTQQLDAALAPLVALFALREQWPVAGRITALLPRDTAYARALSEIIRARTQAEAPASLEPLDRDLQVILAMPRDRQRDSMLDTLARLLAQAGQWERALLAARALAEEERRLAAIGAVAITLARREQISMANSVIDEILTRHNPADIWHRIHAMCEVARALGRAARETVAADLLERAAGHVAMLPDPRAQSSARLHIAQVLIEIGRLEAALPMLEMIVAGMRMIGDAWQRSQALALGASVVALARRHDLAIELAGEAIAVARAIDNPASRVSALWGIAQRLDGAAALHEQAVVALQAAVAAAPIIGNVTYRVTAQATIAGMLAQFGVDGAAELLRQAIVLLPRIDTDDALAQANEAIAAAYARLGQLDQAIAIAQSVSVGWRRDAALGQIAARLAGESANQRALELLREIKAPELRARALGDVAAAAAQHGQVLQAMTLLGDDIVMSDPPAHTQLHAETLIATAQALGAAQQYDRLLQWVRKHWLGAESSVALLQLLPMASELIALQPDLGLALTDAFVWLDAALQGGSNA